jgi:bifunctional DNA-binding transcriptional regulator/antitoxin component of YhaV-PrlF toxin-antitoxin module
MTATIQLDKFNRLPVSRQLRESAGIKQGQPLQVTTSHGRIIIEAPRAHGKLVRRKGLLVWTGAMPEGMDSAKSVREMRDEI